MYPGSTEVCVSRIQKLNMIYFEDILDPLCVSSVYSTVECVPLSTVECVSSRHVYPVVYTLWVSAVFSVCVSMVHVFNDKL